LRARAARDTPFASNSAKMPEKLGRVHTFAAYPVLWTHHFEAKEHYFYVFVG
jgi:hypothetical protein